MFYSRTDNSGPRVELADLILIKKRRLSEWEGTIIQTKFEYKGTDNPSTKNQKKLYETWPNFDLVKPPFNNHHFNIKRTPDEICKFMNICAADTRLLIGSPSDITGQWCNFLSAFLEENSNRNGRSFYSNEDIRGKQLDELMAAISAIGRSKANKDYSWDMLLNAILNVLGKREFIYQGKFYDAIVSIPLFFSCFDQKGMINLPNLIDLCEMECIKFTTFLEFEI